MAFLRSDILNYEFILSAVRALEKTKQVVLDALTTGFPIEGTFQDIIKIQVKATVRGKEQTYNWEAKLPPRNECVGSAGRVLGVWEKEVKVYRELFPFFETQGEAFNLGTPLHPTLIFTKTEVNKECILLSDLCMLGFEDCRFPLSGETVLLAVQSLARMHALGYAYWKSSMDTKWLVDNTPYAGKSFTPLLELVRSQDTLDSAVRVQYASRLENLFSSEAYSAICREVFSPRDGLFNVVCHGRPTVSNLLQWEPSDRPGEVAFVNFSEARICQPAIDLAILLYTSTQRQFRKEGLSHVLKSYHTELEDSLLQLGFPVHTYPFSQLVEDYQDAVVPAVGVAVNLLPGLIGTGDETDCVGAVSGRAASLLVDILEEMVELDKI